MMQDVIGCRCGVLVSALVVAVVSGCAHTPPPEPAAAAAVADEPVPVPKGPKGPVPAQIEIRVLVTAYRGAKGANPALERTQDEALERSRMLSSMAKTGDQLIGLVPTYSDRKGAVEDLGVFRLDTTQPGPFGAAVTEAALALEIGAISQPVATPEGYVVIERLKDPPPGPERIAAKHILIGYVGSPQQVPGATRSQAEARELAAQVLKQAREAGADWDALAAQYTDEPGGKKTGGDLGKFGHGQMVPAFDAAAFALAVGQISDIVQSPFGFHIIRRYE
jgi:NIMA-interacting peptidyl-prolyl cis-trans isomerase 1